jgi:hypothetical protein
MNPFPFIATTTDRPRSRTRGRLGLVAGLTALLLALSASAASAGQPIRVALELPDSIELPAGAGCDFPILLDILVNREVNTTIEKANGEVWTRTNGRLVVRVTNEWNDHSVVVNISGPGLNVVHADGSATLTFYGKGLPFADGEFFVSSGPIVQEIAPDGTLLSTSAPQGSARDLCAELG